MEAPLSYNVRVFEPSKKKIAKYCLVLGVASSLFTALGVWFCLLLPNTLFEAIANFLVALAFLSGATYYWSWGKSAKIIVGEDRLTIKSKYAEKVISFDKIIEVSGVYDSDSIIILTDLRKILISDALFSSDDDKKQFIALLELKSNSTVIFNLD